LSTRNENRRNAGLTPVFQISSRPSKNLIMKIRLQLSIRLLLVIVAFSLANSCAFSQKRERIDSLRSPSGEFELTFWRENNGTVQYITLTTKHRDKEIKTANPLYYEIDYDGDKARPFEDAFPEKQWLSSRIMRLGNSYDNAPAPNFVIIRNNSGRDIDQAVVDAGATFIIYGLTAGETVNIPVKWSERLRGSLIGLTATTSFTDGGSIPVKAELFPFPTRTDDGNFDVSVGDKNISMQRSNK
jgi:hypothetical protein